MAEAQGPISGIRIAGGAAREAESQVPAEPAAGELNLPLDVRALERVYLTGRRRAAGVEPSAPRIGLAFSGGGIRSATFNLGVAQALSKHGLLRGVDYLSTVSGGGYFGSCLSSYLSHPADEVKPETQTTRRSSPEAIQSATEAPPLAPNLWHAESQARWGVRRWDFPFHQRAPLQHLRTYGDFLVMRDMFLSRDVLRVVGIVLTGLLATVGMYLSAMSALAALSLVLVRAMGGGRLWAQLATNRPSWHAFTQEWLPRPADRLSFVCAAAIGALFGLGTWAYNLKQPTTRAASEGETKDDRSEGRRLFWTAFTLGVFPFTLCCLCVLAPWLQQVPYLYFDAITWLWLPVFYSLGVLVMATLMYAIVLPRLRRIWDLRHRSRLGAVGALGLYGSAWFAIMACLPAWMWGVRWLDSLAPPTWTAIFTLLGTRLLARPSAGADHKLRAAVTRIALMVIVPVALVATLVALGGLWIQVTNAFDAWWMPHVICGVSACLVALHGYFVDYNRVSPHYFYRDRLAEAFLRTEDRGGGRLMLARDDEQLPLAHLHGRLQAYTQRSEEALARELSAATRAVVETDALPDDEPVKAAAHAHARSAYGLVDNAAPYHLIVCALNLAGSKDLARRDRKSDHFVFSRLYCGSTTTGYEHTDLYDSGRVELARAMTISGAAAAAAAGAFTSTSQAFVATLFNIRLGYWMSRPRRINNSGGLEGVVQRATDRGIGFWPYYLLLEMFGQTTAQHRMINLSDGGHTGDNTALCPLLQRRCDVMLICDAGCDPLGTCEDLAAGARIAYVEENTVVSVDSSGFARSASGESKTAYALGTVDYAGANIATSSDRDAAAKRGHIIYLKSSLPAGDLPLAVRAYAATHPEFPHESTGDQFFDDAQFEAYRALGEALATRMIAELSTTARLPQALRSWLMLDAEVEQALEQSATAAVG